MVFTAAKVSIIVSLQLQSNNESVKLQVGSAGDGELVRVDSFVNVQVQVGSSEVVRMDLGVMELPVDDLIGLQLLEGSSRVV